MKPALHVRGVGRIRSASGRSAPPAYELESGVLDFAAHRRISHDADAMAGSG
jgi:hypothetical protein